MRKKEVVFTKKSSSNGIVGGLAWSFAERMTAQLVSTIVGIVLARILSPEHYGIIAIVMVFITICNVFVTSGFGTAIVQKKYVDESDYNTAFIMSLAISVAMYVALFLSAPLIADFYQMDELCLVIRILGIILIITSVNTIQQAHIQRAMQFKKFFIATSFGTIISGIVGVTCALKGFGVWALVAQYLTNTTVDTIVLLVVDKWKPKFNFSVTKAKEIYSFGWKVLCTELVFTLENDIRSLLVGKVFGPADLAFYDQGKKYPSLLVNNVNSSIQKVLLPVLSRKQDDLIELKNTLRKCVKVGMYILCPILIGFASVSKVFVIAVLTEKWLFAVPYMIIFSISYLTRPIESACHQAILAIGKSGLVFWIMVAINATSLAGVIFSTFVLRSVLWIAIFSLITTLISLCCFFIATNVYINYTFHEQLLDTFPVILMSSVMGGVVYFIGTISINVWILLMLQIISGAAIYLGLSMITNNEAYSYVRNMIRQKIK